MPKLSVIIPIYNPGKVLRRTLKSIQMQTFKDFECLLIDDGSKEAVTKIICQKIIVKDNRFKYFRKENEGIEKTRLYGVNKSNTPLLIFCDHDDYYEEEAFQKLHENFLKSDADIVSANCYVQVIRGVKLTRRENRLGINNEIILNHDEFIRNHYLNFFGIHTFPVSTWGKLYKKQLFNDVLELHNVNILEDVVINLQLFARATKIHFISDYVYTHMWGGLSSTFDIYSAIDGYNTIYKFRKKYLMKYDLPIKSLLIEYKNIVNQRVCLMIDNNYNVDEFHGLINKLNNHEIFIDLLTELTSDEKGNYISLIEVNNAESLLSLASQDSSIVRRIKHKIKKNINLFT